MQYIYRFPGFRHKALTFSYDDGVVEDQRLVALFQRYGLAGTFNLNSGLLYEEGKRRHLSREAAKALYDQPGIEVAMHTYTHPHLEWEPSQRVMYEVVEDRRRLEELFGHPVTGFAYPYGTYQDHVVEVLRQAGVKYARTTVSTGRFDMPQDWLRMPATCHHNDPHLMELAERFLSITEQEERRDRPRLSMFYVWGHSYEFTDHDNWQVIEEFAAKMSGRADIWYATNGEIYDYTKAIERLEISVDGRYCYNPSVIDVYFYAGAKQYIVHAGETLTIA